MKNNKFNIEEKNGLFVFSDSVYEVYHKSDDINLGYKKFKNLLDKKEKFLKKNNIDINDKKKINLDNAHKHTIKSQILSNFIRSILLIGTFLILVFISSLAISNVIKENEIKGGRQFWKNFENEIVKFSEKEIDLETQSNIITSLRKIREKYKPFFKEIGIILD